jgi:hypothetical protein
VEIPDGLTPEIVLKEACTTVGLPNGDGLCIEDREIVVFAGFPWSETELD